MKIYLHRLGDDQSKDALVYERPDHPHWWLGADTSEDGRYLWIYISEGGEANALYYLDLQKPGSKAIPIVDRFDASFQVMGNLGSVLYIFTNDHAPRGKVITIDLQHPAPAQWRTIVPQQEQTMEAALLASGKLICSYLADAHSATTVYSLDGTMLQNLQLPGLGHTVWSHSSQNDKDVFFTYNEFTRPPSILRFNLATMALSLFRSAKVAFDPKQFEAQQVFYHSKDGTRVPMFVISRQGTELNSPEPDYPVWLWRFQ